MPANSSCVYIIMRFKNPIRKFLYIWKEFTKQDIS